MTLLKKITHVFDRIRHEIGANDLYSRTRLAHIEPFDEGEFSIHKPTLVFYAIKIAPDFAHTQCNMKLICNGSGLGAAAHVPSGIAGAFDEMCGHLVRVNDIDFLEGNITLAEFNSGAPLSRILDMFGGSDPLLSRLAAAEQENGILFETPDSGRTRPPQKLDCK